MNFLKRIFRRVNLIIFNKRDRIKKHNQLNKTIKKIKTPGSTILIGSVLSSLGGLAHHIQALAKYSAFKPNIFPAPEDLAAIRKWNTLDTIKKHIDDNGLNYKILHSHVDPWFINICLKQQKLGTKWGHTYHTLYFEKDWDNGLQPWQIEINNCLINVARKADVRISISHWLQTLLLEKYNIETIYIPNGVDVVRCDKADANRFIKKYKEKDFVLFASGISDIKNPGEFIKLAHAIPEKQFVIIGRQISFQALTEKYKTNIPKNLMVIGQMPHRELLDALAACSVFIVTSRSEGLPTVLMEAMALERTVVGCDTYGTKEVIGDERYGYIYDHTSFDDLVAKTKAALTSPKGKQARKRILENYDWQVVIPQIDDIYSKLIS